MFMKPMMVIQTLVLRVFTSLSLSMKKTIQPVLNSVENKKADEENVYYTLSGVRVINPTEKGVYIKNGKKVIIR